MIQEREIYPQEPTRNVQIDVGTSSQVISYARNIATERTELLLRNTSTSTNDVITISVGSGLSENNKGIVLKMNESIAFSNETGYKIPQGTFSAICQTANGKLTIFER